jgi:divalent metal cation (Fe/Co/Zn/Cd) transporter
LNSTPAQHQKAVRLEILTLSAVTIEAVVGLAAGMAAGSLALVSFGLDSVIEFVAASVVLWHLRGARRGKDKALRIIAATFFALAIYIVVEAADGLYHHHHPSSAPIGIALVVVSFAAMQYLGRAKQRLGHDMESDALEADAEETLLCSYLSVVVLVGLVLNAALSWWWADPLAALVVAALAIREGIEAWRGGHH